MFYPRRAVLALPLALVWTSCGPAALPASHPTKLLGEPMPKFTRRALDGQPASTADAAGKIVVVKFFAKYCEPCKKTLPAAEKLYQANKGNVIVIGVAEDERQSDVDAVVQQYHLTFPIIHDRGNILIGRFRTSELPATFVSDKTGTIRWMGGPGQGHGDLRDAVAWLLAR